MSLCVFAEKASYEKSTLNVLCKYFFLSADESNAVYARITLTFSFHTFAYKFVAIQFVTITPITVAGQNVKVGGLKSIK